MSEAKLLSAVVGRSGEVTMAFLRDGETLSYTVSSRAYEALALPPVGESISSEILSRIVRLHEGRAASAAALSILASGDKSCRALAERLVERGFARDAAAYAADRMRRLGYIKEEETACRLAVSMSKRNLWGPRRIVFALLAKGYSSEIAESAVSACVSSGEIDFHATKEMLIRRLSGKAPDPLRLRAALYRYGYED